MKLSFKWADHSNAKAVWEEVAFSNWGEDVPALGHFISLNWVKDGKPVQLKGVVRDVSWSLNVGLDNTLKTSVVIQLGDY